MSAITCMPSVAELRETTLAELRVERLRHQLVVAHLDYIAIGVKNGVIPPESVPLLLAELFNTVDEVSE